MTTTELTKDIRTQVAGCAPFIRAFLECSTEIQSIVLDMISIIEDADTDEDAKQHASDAIYEALFPGLSTDIQGIYKDRLTNSAGIEANAAIAEEGATFAENVRTKMAEIGMKQHDLADKINVSQPAISNILTRACRPQRRTVEKIADALGVTPNDLWPGFNS